MLFIFPDNASSHQPPRPKAPRQRIRPHIVFILSLILVFGLAIFRPFLATTLLAREDIPLTERYAPGRHTHYDRVRADYQSEWAVTLPFIRLEHTYRVWDKNDLLNFICPSYRAAFHHMTANQRTEWNLLASREVRFNGANAMITVEVMLDGNPTPQRMNDIRLVRGADFWQICDSQFLDLITP